jgi:hypothetical protein
MPLPALACRIIYRAASPINIPIVMLEPVAVTALS